MTSTRAQLNANGFFLFAQKSGQLSRHRLHNKADLLIRLRWATKAASIDQAEKINRKVLPSHRAGPSGLFRPSAFSAAEKNQYEVHERKAGKRFNTRSPARAILRIHKSVVAVA